MLDDPQVYPTGIGGDLISSAMVALLGAAHGEASRRGDGVNVRIPRLRAAIQIRFKFAIRAPGLGVLPDGATKWSDGGGRNVPKSGSLWSHHLRMMPHYAVAILAVAAAFVAELLLNHFLQSTPFITVFLCAILLAAWLGGAGPGLLATALSVLVLVFYFIPELDPSVGRRQEVARVLIFAVAALFAVWICAAQRRTAQSLLGARAELEVTVQTLEKLNEEQRQTQARLAGAERELRLTLDSIPAIIWRGGPNGYVQQLNKRWFEYTGTTYEEVRGRKWKSCVHPDDLAHLVDAGDKYVASGIPIDSEARLRRFDGEYRWFLFRPVPARDETGRIVAWYGAVLDIEDRKRAEQKAVEAERQAEETRRDAQDKLAHANRVATIGQLTASITHEVNQPIAAARTSASAALNFLSSSPPNLEEVKEALECVVKDTDRTGAVVTRIRALMRRSPMRTDSVDINEAVREVIELTRGEALKNKVACKRNSRMVCLSSAAIGSSCSRSS